ncbi:cellulose biosynthesis cyclic di-GMP-binding regulatory protein BcsB [Motilimonas pumila]|uniref:Cyclic di-GMP-binding protein n=1 Tax=Motilimonas pumila TaxID=2303987 RepID=A0A418YFT1_9GAMM|nr:cellulose biosynthesis cyclic di-GMP-binding regulatory protein BcsB [Motilimonas pumila]RJG48403.1 cellulose biosynthesis cyclic di-GMP-binding regulatory protein BcsB [Motilimonas pumila]
MKNVLLRISLLYVLCLHVAWAQPEPSTNALKHDSADATVTAKDSSPSSEAQTADLRTGVSEEVLVDTSNDGTGVAQHSYTFADLGQTGSLKMQGSESTLYVGFGSRLDQIVTGASLQLDFIPSPALMEVVSHLRVFLNDELMGVVTIQSEDSGAPVKADINLDPRFMSNFNQLKFELIGSVEQSCANPNDPSIWSEISSASRLNLTVKKTTVENELSLFPAPFFDARDFGDLNLPMVVPAGFGLQGLRAAAIMTSYFGSLADWRDTQFPLFQNHLPERHSIVFLTNRDRPTFLANFPTINSPSIQVINHPQDKFAKLLLVMGQDEQALTQAVLGLVAGNPLMSGPMAEITAIKDIPTRAAYDAPRWINTARPVTFAELIDGPYQLQTRGVDPAPIDLNFRLPPDLFLWQAKGTPLQLNYRYSPLAQDNSASRLSMRVNGIFSKGIPLDTSGESKSDVVRLPMIEQGVAGSQAATLPGFRLGERNTLSFVFSFVASTDGICQPKQGAENFAVMDESSSIDFSGFAHYLEMPNLSVFAKSAYPFSRFADLSQTVVLLPEAPSKHEVQLLLDVMGRIGKETGLAAYHMSLQHQWQASSLSDKDVLVIAKQAEQAFDWSEQDLAHLLSAQGERSLGGKQSGEGAATLELQAQGQFASMVSFQSPFSSQRTVVVLNGQDGDSLSLITEAINNATGEFLFGAAAAIRPASVTSFESEDTYFVGELPVLQLIWYHFSGHPVLIALIAVFLVVVFSVLVWRALRVVAAKRLAQGEEDE